MTFRIVRKDGVELVDAVNAAVASMGSDDSRSSTEKAMGAVDAYLAAARFKPTDAEIDELCRAMWNDTDQWGHRAHKYNWGDWPEVMKRRRKNDRAAMRKFLEHLS